jgi:hypothetical protein
VAATAEEVRTWTDQSGAITKQGSIDRVDKNWVHLRLSDGGTVRLPISWLSQADQEYLARAGQPAARDPEPTPGSSTVLPAEGSTEGAEPPSSVVTLTVEGVGVSKDDAERDAYRNAVRQVVGAYVDSETIVANDEVIRDKVITLSSAYVEKAATKSVAQENGLFKVRVDAKVRVTKLLDALKQHNVSFVEVDPSAAQDAIAKALTQEDQEKGRDDLLARALRSYPEGCLKATVDGEPTFTKTSIKFKIKVEPDMDAFAAVADKLCEALAADGRRNGTLRNDSKHFHFFDVHTTDDALQFEDDALNTIARHFHTTQHLGLANVDVHNFARTVKKAGTLACGPIFSLAMETPRGLRNPAFAIDNPDYNDLFFIPFRANKSLQRVHWRWYAFEKGESEQFLAKHRHAAAVASSLLAANGDEVADDITAINLGWSVVSSQIGSWVLAPFFCGARDSAYYVPSFTFQRSLDLAPEELKQIRTVKCSVQAAEWPRDSF